MSRILKYGIMAAWAVSPILYILWETPDKISETVSYEYLWWISMLFIVSSPWLVKKISGWYIPNYQLDYNRLHQYWKLLFYWLYIAISIGCIWDFAASTIDKQANSLGNPYATPVAIILLLARITVFLPSVFNVFINFILFYLSIKDKFCMINDINALFDARIYLLSYKRINRFLYACYFIIFLCTIFAFRKKNFMTLLDAIVSSFNTGEFLVVFDLTYMLHMLYLLAPIIIALIYYYYASNCVRRLVMDAIVRIHTLTEDDWKKIEFVYFNNDSVYNIGNIFISYLTLFVPILMEWLLGYLNNTPRV